MIGILLSTTATEIFLATTMQVSPLDELPDGAPWVFGDDMFVQKLSMLAVNGETMTARRAAALRIVNDARDAVRDVLRADPAMVRLETRDSLPQIALDSCCGLGAGCGMTYECCPPVQDHLLHVKLVNGEKKQWSLVRQKVSLDVKVWRERERV